MSVAFDGVSVPVSDMTYVRTTAVVTVTPPPHAPGAVDVVVAMAATSMTARASFVYLDPGAPVDRFLFEPVLLPVSFEGAGAFGSQWKSDNVVAPADWPAVARSPLPCAGCTSVITAARRLDVTNDPAGLLLWIARTPEPAMFANSRIREVSRQPQSTGTEIPVVREHDFRRASVRLLNVPYDGHSRATLRIWALGDPGGLCFLDASSQSAYWLPILSSVPLQRSKADALWFGSADITATLQQTKAGETASIRVTPLSADPDIALWAMISVTNNDTQQVTIVSSN